MNLNLNLNLKIKKKMNGPNPDHVLVQYAVHKSAFGKLNIIGPLSQNYGFVFQTYSKSVTSITTSVIKLYH